MDGPLPKLRGERQDRRASARAPRQTPAGPAGSPGTPCAGDPTGRRGGGRRGAPAILPNGARGGPCAGRACTCPQRRLAEHAPRAAGRPGARRRPPQWTHLIPEDRVDPPRAGGNAGGRRLLNRLGLQSAGRRAAPPAQLPPAARAGPPSEVGPACGGHLSRPSRPAPSRAPAAPSPAGLEGPAEQRGCRPDEASSSSPPLPAGEEDPALSSGSHFRYQRSCSCTCRLTPGPLTLGGGCGLLNRLLPPGSPPQLS